jgi:energy-coupling factor transporter ATP-binding protein EcfA2
MPEQDELFAVDPAKVFSPTAPIDEKSLFAGRRSEITAVIRAVNQKGQHAILFGERGVGKTSLANVLSAFLHSPTYNILSPRVNCDTMDTFDRVWRKILDEILMHQKIKSAGFTESPTKSYTASELLGDEVTPDGVRRALTIISKSSLPILIIDEFDRLDRNVKRGIADTIKTLSDHAVPATVVLVGVADSVDDLIEEHESVERALIQVRILRMSSLEIGEIITTGIGRLQISIEPAALQRMCILAQGLPYYAHLLGLESAILALEKNGASPLITVDTLGIAISQAIANSQQSIKSAWHQATTSPRPDNLFADVLLACALAKTDELGYFAAQDVRDPLCQILGRRVDIANYAQHLSDFSTKRGTVLQRIGEKRRFRFRFANPLMQPFVIMQGFSAGKIPDDTFVQLHSD